MSFLSPGSSRSGSEGASTAVTRSSTAPSISRAPTRTAIRSGSWTSHMQIQPRRRRSGLRTASKSRTAA